MLPIKDLKSKIAKGEVMTKIDDTTSVTRIIRAVVFAYLEIFLKSFFVLKLVTTIVKKIIGKITTEDTLIESSAPNDRLESRSQIFFLEFRYSYINLESKRKKAVSQISKVPKCEY